MFKGHRSEFTLSRLLGKPWETARTSTTVVGAGISLDVREVTIVVGKRVAGTAVVTPIEIEGQHGEMIGGEVEMSMKRTDVVTPQAPDTVVVLEGTGVHLLRD